MVPLLTFERGSIGVGGFALLLLVGARVASSTTQIASAERAVRVSYAVRIRAVPSDARVAEVWIPLATTSAEQEILQRDVHAPASSTVAREPVYGNEILHLALRPPFSEEARVSVEYRALLRDGSARSFHEPQPSAAQWARYRSAEGLMRIDEEVRSRARLASIGRATLEERAQAIYDQVIERMAYDKAVPGWGRGDTRRACRLGKGNCTDFHSLFISMARAAGIPARFKIGVMIPPERAGMIAGYHCWAEFYEEGRGWVSVDASEAWKHPGLADHYFGSRDADRFLLSVGRHLDLVPRQRGEPVNIFLFPYVEVDGKAFNGVDTEIRFTDLNTERAT